MLPRGGLLLDSRGAGRRWAAYSTDGGERFTAPVVVPDRLDPGVNGSVVPARPDVWVEAGPTHEIDLDDFTGVDPAVFKEIGQGRGGAQVLRTRESLMANLGPIRPGIHTGDRLEVHARVRAEYEPTSDADAFPSLHVRWADQERSLSPGESWLRRDLTYVVTTEDTERGYAEVSCAVVIDGGELQARLRLPTQSSTSRGGARRPRRGGPDQAGWSADGAVDQ